MVTKALKRKGVELGFVQIPAKNRVELLGETVVSFATKLDDSPENRQIWAFVVRLFKAKVCHRDESNHKKE